MAFVSLTTSNHIGIVTMDRPPVNAINLQMYQEIKEIFLSINERDDIWTVVFRAEGKSFSTGNDVSEFNLMNPDQVLPYARIVSDSVASVYECRAPVIAAVNGMALGAGMALASCSDIIIAAEDATFGLPEIKVGIVGAACFLSRILPQSTVRHMAYSGDSITAEEMKRFGAVMQVAPPGQLDDISLKLANRYAQRSPLALRGFKKAIYMNECAMLKEKYMAEIDFTRNLAATEDFKEAICAFREKRKPVFKGR
jgi:enoyl-CoA hydratase